MDERVMSRHERVFSHIQEQIVTGELRPGTKLNGERGLAEQLNVSRETVRQGLKLAEEAGIVVRMPTLGTFVAPPRVDQELGEMSSFSSTIRQMRLEPTYGSVSVSPGMATANQAMRLQVNEGDPVLRITAIGIGSDLPLAFYESVLPDRVVSQLPESPPWTTDATYQIAARALGASELLVAQEFESIGMPRMVAQILKVPPGAPSFRSTGVFSSGGVPLEMRTAMYPGGRYRFRISRHVRL